MKRQFNSVERRGEGEGENLKGKKNCFSIGSGFKMKNVGDV